MRTKLLAMGSTLLLVAGLISLGAGPASATDTGQVCEGFDSGKIDVQGSHKTLDIVAPTGKLIDGYCIKAGSVEQGLGPKWVDVDPPAAAVTIVYPAADKDISHYALSYTDIVVPPPSTPKDADASVTMGPATCDLAGRQTQDTAVFATFGPITYTANTYSVTATAVSGHEFADGTTSKLLTGPIEPQLASQSTNPSGACYLPSASTTQVAMYLYKKLNVSAPAAWENSGQQTFIKSKVGSDWYTTFPATLPSDVCGPGWAVQQDMARGDLTDFTWPSTITYPTDNIGWPPLINAIHQELSELVTVPDCHTPPKTQVCSSTGGVAITNLAGMDFSETRTQGHYELVSNGLHIWTTGPDLSLSKSAGYIATDFALKDAGVPALDYTTTSGASAGLNLTLYVNGSWLGNLTYEPLFAKYWTNHAIAGLPAGPNPSYQQAYGTLDEILAAYDAHGITDLRVKAVGYSLGSGAVGDGIVNSITAGCVKYTFDYVAPPTVRECSAITDGGVSTNLIPNGWTFSETRATGHNDYVAGGLRVWTEGNTSTDKAAAYHALNAPLADIGQPGIDFASYSGVRPGMQIVLDADGDGTPDGILVGEPWSYGNGMWWSHTIAGPAAGLGYEHLGTLNEYLAANPAAKVKSIGYSLGSGVLGDATITAITMGCAKYTFDYVAPPTVVSIQLTYMTDCAPDETNSWRVTNPSSEPVVVGYGDGQTFTAQPGQSTFNTPRGTETMALSWGGGETGIASGSTVKASGNDQPTQSTNRNGACYVAPPQVMNPGGDARVNCGNSSIAVHLTNLGADVNTTADIDVYVNGVFNRTAHVGANSETWFELFNLTLGDRYHITAVQNGKTVLDQALVYNCTITLTVADPTSQDQICTDGKTIGGSIWVDLKDHLAYTIDGTPVTDATTELAPGTYTVKVTADPGYVLTGDPEWKLTIAAAEDCGQLVTHPLVTPVVTWNNLTCTAGGSYTLGAIEGVLWTVDGEPASAGTYAVNAARTVHISAAADGPDFGLEPDVQTEWTLVFATPTDCGQLTTLAMTGTDGNTINLGLLFAGGLLLLGGACVYAERRLRFGRD